MYIASSGSCIFANMANNVEAAPSRLPNLVGGHVINVKWNRDSEIRTHSYIKVREILCCVYREKNTRVCLKVASCAYKVRNEAHCYKSSFEILATIGNETPENFA